MVKPASIANAVGAPEAAAVDAAGARQLRRAAIPAGSGGVPAPMLHFLLDSAAFAGVGRAGTRAPRRPRTGRTGWAPPWPLPRPPPHTPSTSRSRASGDLAFLSDPNLTIEEKLMRLLASLSDRWEKEMQSKLDQIAADEKKADGSGSGASGAGKKGGGGLLGGIGDVFSGGGGIFSDFLGGSAGGIFGGVLSGIVGGAGGGGLGGMFDFLKIPGVKGALEKLSGPVLAAAASVFGFPMAAPLMMKLGPALVDGAARLASAVDEVGARSGSPGSTARSSGSRSAGGTTGSDGAEGDGKKMSDGQRQLLTMEIQRIFDRQKEMFGIVSNILKSGHDTRMATINNIR